MRLAPVCTSGNHGFGQSPSSEKMLTMGAFEGLAQEKYVSLTTFKRDGTPASTPVWVVGDGGRLLVHTGASTWKVRRIRRDAHVRVAPCTATGKVRGDAVDGEATLVDETAEVERLLARKYGLTYSGLRAVNALIRRVRRRPAEPSVTIAIAPVR